MTNNETFYKLRDSLRGKERAYRNARRQLRRELELKPVRVGSAFWLQAAHDYDREIKAILKRIENS